MPHICNNWIISRGGGNWTEGNFWGSIFLSFLVKEVKVKAHTSQRPNRLSLYRFPQNTACLEVYLLPPGCDVSLSQGYPPAVCRWYPFIHLGEGRQSGVKFLVCHDGRGLNPRPPDLKFEVLTARSHASTSCERSQALCS